jgi:transcriptional regulator NrdR family protein
VKCPKCNEPMTIWDSRQSTRLGGSQIRRYECPLCKTRATTYEVKQRELLHLERDRARLRTAALLNAKGK